MIWNDPKCAPVIDALGPAFECPERGSVFSLECARCNGWGQVWGLWERSHKGEKICHPAPDFLVGCILAEFAREWLAERRSAVVLVGGDHYVVSCNSPEAGMGFLCECGKFHFFGDKPCGSDPREFALDEYPLALAEGMLAFLREEGKR